MTSADDGVDLDLRVGLSVTLTRSLVLLGLVVENVNLLALAVLDDLGLDGGAFNDGSSELGAVVADNSQDLVKNDFVAIVDVELFDKEDVALSDAVLLTAGLDNCVQQLLAPSFFSLAIGVRHKPSFEYPFKAALSV